jgi:imidazolonepropionase-like amidohydrolase
MFLSARRLFDGRTPEVFDDWGIEIEDGRIVDVGPFRAMRPGSDVVDLGDVTLLPGLVDVHQHLAFDASDDPAGHLQADDDATLMARMRQAAQCALAAGITTIRDLGDRGYLSLTLRDEFRNGPEIGPRILASGPPLTVTVGHCWFLGGEVDGEDGIRRAVRDRVARGVDVIKVMATGGNMTPTLGPHESQYTRAELAAAADEAHAHGLPLAVHAHGPQGIADARAVGADSIEHCTFFTADGVDADPDVLDQLAGSATGLSMTAAVLPDVDPRFPAMRQRLAQGLTTTTAVAAEVCGIAQTTGTLETGKDADILAVAGNPLEDITAIHDVIATYARGQRAPQPN